MDWPSPDAAPKSGINLKKEMRAAAIARRAALPAAARQAGSIELAATDWIALLGQPPCTVSAFCSMGEELDTQPLLERLGALGYDLCLPVMQGRGKPLVFRKWSPGDSMASGTWGIQEPTEDKPVLHPDVVLAPLLAFDREGWRLGYGGGFYDRTVRELRSLEPIRFIGLAFAEQEVDAVPHLEYDERLDAVLTPRGLIDVT